MSERTVKTIIRVIVDLPMALCHGCGAEKLLSPTRVSDLRKDALGDLDYLARCEVDEYDHPAGWVRVEVRLLGPSYSGHGVRKVLFCSHCADEWCRKLGVTVQSPTAKYGPGYGVHGEEYQKARDAGLSEEAVDSAVKW